MKHTSFRTIILSLAFVLIAFSVMLSGGCEPTSVSSKAQSNVEIISDYSVPLAAPASDASEAFDSTPVRGAAPIAQPPVSRERATEAPKP